MKNNKNSLKTLLTTKNRIMFKIKHNDSLKAYLRRTAIGARIMGYTREQALAAAKEGMSKGYNDLTEI